MNSAVELNPIEAYSNPNQCPPAYYAQTFSFCVSEEYPCHSGLIYKREQTEHKCDYAQVCFR